MRRLIFPILFCLLLVIPLNAADKICSVYNGTWTDVYFVVQNYVNASQNTATALDASGNLSIVAQLVNHAIIPTNNKYVVVYFNNSPVATVLKEGFTSSITLPEGRTTVTVKFFLWNILTGWEVVASTTVYVRKDNTAPAITFGNTNNGNWYNNPAGLNVSAYATDGGVGADVNTWQNRIRYSGYTGSWSSAGSTRNRRLITREGITYVDFNVQDLVDNAGTGSTVIKIDTLSPVISISPAALPWSNAGTIMVTAAGQDPNPGGVEISGLNTAAWSYALSGGQSESGSGQNAVVTNEGTTRITFTVYDRAGNRATASEYIHLDRQAPRLSLTAATTGGYVPPNGWFKEKAVVTATADDSHNSLAVSGVARLQYRIGVPLQWEDFIFAPGTVISGSLEVESEGITTIWFQASDTANNSSSLSEPAAQIELMIDKTAPVVNATGSGGWVNADSVTPYASVVDNLAGIESVIWWFADNPAVKKSAVFDPADGLYKAAPVNQNGETALTFEATDRAGNSSQETCLVQLDNAAPLLTCGPVSTLWQGTAITVQLSAQDTGTSGIDISSWQVSENGTDWTDLNPQLPGEAIAYTITREGDRVTYFRVQDTTGIWSNRVTVPTKIDYSPPEIQAEDPDWTAGDTAELLLTITDPGNMSGVNAASLQYSFDQAAGPWKAVASSISGSLYTVAIPVAEPGSGVYPVFFRVADQVGNSGAAAAATVRIDRSPPVLSSIQVFADTRELGGEEYTFISNLLIIPEAADNTGLRSFKWGLYADYQAEPQPDRTIPADQTFYLNIPGSGVWYLYLQPVDLAGNSSSQVYERMIRVDLTRPDPPRIESSSHPLAAALTDAVPFTDAVFTVYPSAAGNSGVAGYTYQLLAGPGPESATILASGQAIGGIIGFTGLADNNPDEYYFLQVVLEAGNGRESLPACYWFRIDSTPPENLVVMSQSHPDGEKYYPSASAVLSWNKPLDFTGISSYYYKAAAAKILPETMPAGYAPDESWSTTGNQAVVLELAAILGAESGTVYAAVCAEDFAGNRQFDELVVCFDMVRPVIDGEIIINVDAEARSANIIWPQPVDNIGIDHQEVKLATVDAAGNLADLSHWIVTKQESSHTFTGVDADEAIIYAVLVKAVDTAGNSTLRVKGFNFAGDLITIDIITPFSVNIKGYTVQGSYASGSGTGEARLLLPLNLQFTVGGVLQESVLLTDVSFSADGDFLAGANPGVSYTVNLAGYDCSGTGVAFSAAGLSFLSLNLEVEVEDGVSGSFTYVNVLNTAAPPMILVDPVRARAAEGFAFRSRFWEQGAEEPAAVWRLTDITVTGLDQSEWLLEDSSLDLEESGSTVNAYQEEPGGARDYHLPLTRTAVSPDREISGGEVTAPFVLEAGGNIFEVARAKLQGNKLHILQARVRFAAGLSGQVLTLENFSIDYSGLLQEEAGFTAGGFSFTVDGIVYTAESIAITGGMLFITQGTITTGGGQTIMFSGLGLVYAGINKDFPASLASFEAQVHGFHLSSTQAVLEVRGIYLPEAAVTMPPQFGGGEKTVNELVLDPADFSVIQSGYGEGSFMLDTTYGEEILATGMTINQNGVFADTIMVTLPEIINPQAAVAEFSNLELFGDGSSGRSDPIENFMITVGGFSSAASLLFTAERVVVNGAGIALDEDWYPQQLSFAELALSRNAVTKPGLASDELTVFKNGWFIEVVEITLDDTGVHGVAAVELPYEYGNRSIVFNDFTIFPDSSYATGFSTAEFYVDIHGWKVRAARIALEGADLKIGQAAVMLYSVMGWGELPIPDVVLGPDGEVSSAVGTAPRSFLATNGFKVETDAYQFTPRGLYLSGMVYLPAALGEDVFAAYAGPDIFLDADGAVLTPVPDADAAPPANSLDYSLAGITVRGENFYFNREGFIAARNYVEIPALEMIFAFPEMHYYPDGQVKMAGASFQGFEFDLPGTQVSLGVTEIRLNEKGINLKAFIQLPPAFGEDAVIYFDQLTIDAGGRLTTDMIVSHLEFEVKGLGFEFSHITLDAEGFSLGEALITLPEALEYKTIRITDLTITWEGDFQLGGIGVDPFELWGYVIYLDNLSWSDNTIAFEGGVRFPPDFFIEALAGIRVNIETFSYNFATTAVDFQVSITGTFSFMLMDEYELIVTGVTVNRELIAIDNATLALPEELNADSVEVNGLVINVKNRTIDYESAAINDISFTYESLAFYINQLLISGSEGLILSGSVTLPPEAGDGGGMPDGIAGLVLEVERFQITPDFGIGDIIASVNVDRLPLFDGNFILQDGRLALARTEAEIVINCSGSLLLGSSFPIEEQDQGDGIVIREFEITIAGGKAAITAFAAESTPLNFPVLGLEVIDTVLAVVWEPTTNIFTVEIRGSDATAPARISLAADCFPDALRNKEIMINSFVFDSTPALISFDAGLRLTGSNELFSDIHLVDKTDVPAGIGVGFNRDTGFMEFSLSGTLLFGSSYPEGISGTGIEVAMIRFDTGWNLLDLDISVLLSDDLMLFDCIKVQNGLLHIEKYDNDQLLFTLGGDLFLPDSPDLPEALQGLPVEVGAFSFTSAGEIIEVQISTSGNNTTIYDKLSLKHWEVAAVKNTVNGADELLFTFDGILALPEDPALNDFSGLELGFIIEFSTQRGLINFTASLEEETSFELYAGIMIACTSFAVSMEKFSLAGKLYIPDGNTTFPEELWEKNLVITLAKFEMTWDGEITAIEAGLAHATVTLGGFTTQITNLLFNPDGITMQSCIIILPEILDNKQIAIENAGYTYAGELYGEVTIPVLEIDIGGFILFFEGPDFDCDTYTLSFTRAGLKMPDLIGGGILTINGLSIGPEGLRLTGGGFFLPDFVLAGGLGFKDVGVSFAVDNTGQYMISGGGKIMIPGAGTFGVWVTFVNKSGTYPWGIKYAEFSYTAPGLGLPLGTTGIYLNGIKGSIAFGPPDELPGELQPMFDSGTRLSLELVFTGAAQGKVVRAATTVWVDITDWDWAFQGEVSVLEGVISGTIIAALTNKGFYGSFAFRLAFVKGRVQVYVFRDKATKKTMVSGSGNITFGVGKGSLVNKEIRLWPFKKYIYVTIPNKDYWLPGLNAEFGMFKNKDGKDVKGFKGYVKVPLFGQAGIFVPDKGKFTLGDVSKFSLYQFPGSRSAGSRGMENTESGKQPAGRVFILDEAGQEAVRDNYFFRVPGPGGNQAALPYNRGLDVSGRGVLPDLPNDEPPQDAVERLVIVAGYAEGDPSITVTSPTGRVYAEGMTDVTVTRMEWGCAMVIMNPEAGDGWSIEVGNVIHSDAYYIEVYGKSTVPEMTVATPAYAGETTGSTYQVTGSFSDSTYRGQWVSIYLSAEKDSYLGDLAAVGVIAADGSFAVELDTGMLQDGEYHVYASVERAENKPNVMAYAEGSLTVRNTASLLAPLDFTASDNSEGGIILSFTDPNGERSKGYNLYIENLTDNSRETVWLGYLDNTTIPGFEPGQIIRLRTAAVDYANREGSLSQAVEVEIGGEKQLNNVFEITDELLTIESRTGELFEGVIPYTVAGAAATGQAYDFMEAEIISLPEGINLGFVDRLWRIDRPAGEVNFIFTTENTVTPGTYEAVIRFTSRGNREISDTVTIAARITYPPVEIINITPESWLQGTAHYLEIEGNNFFAGTKVELGGVELVIEETRNAGYLKAILPDYIPEGEHSLKVTGPGYAADTGIVTVLKPYYLILGYKTRVTIKQGQSGTLNFGITGENGFTDSATFRLANVQPGLSASLFPSMITEGTTATVHITVASGTQPGLYTLDIISSQGDILTGRITVSATEPEPHISYLSEITALAGDKITIYGYGFGETGAVTLAGSNAAATSYTPNAIVITVPADGVSGEVTVHTGGFSSNSVLLYVKESGFTVYPAASSLELQPGEEKTIEVAVTGYARSVNLEAATEDMGISTWLSQPVITPNGVTQLTISADSAIANGSYPVTINATDGKLESSKTITVMVGEAFAITTTSLPTAMQGVTYKAAITAENGSGQSLFTLQDGKLPPGLGLRIKGTIEGRPSSPGTYTFTVAAEDQAGRRAEAAFSLTVEENAWSMDDKDGGRTGYNPVPAPADNRILWETGPVYDARQIISGHNRIYLLTGNNVAAYEINTGSLICTYPGRFTVWAYAADTLYLLDDQQTFHAVDGLFGNSRWQRQGVTNFTTDGSTLYLEEAGAISVIDPVTGMLSARLQADLAGDYIYCFKSSLLYRSAGTAVARLTESGWENYFAADGTICDLAADETELAILTDNGYLLLYNPEFDITRRVETSLPAGSITLGAARITITNREQTTTYDRQTLEILHTTAAGAAVTASAAEKIFTADSSGLKAINGYTGATIWQENSAYADLALAGEYAYALKTDGSIICYNGPDNIYPPATQINTVPAQPDGEHGYFITRPTLSLNPADPETYARETWYKLADGVNTRYTGPLNLPEGQYYFTTYSKDSKGYRETDKITSFRVDLGKPVVAAEVSGAPGRGSYYLSAVNIALTATDNLSGMDGIYYRINEGDWLRYNTQLVFNANGEYTFAYKAKDYAGNWSEVTTLSFALDLNNPTADSSLHAEPGLTVVYLNAADKGSGVDYIEYEADGVYNAAYLDPIAFSEPGTHTVKYNAADNAGRQSGWQTVNVETTEFSSGDWVKDLEFKYHIPGRRLVRNIQAGDKLYTPSSGRHNTLKDLPDYLTGADYILLHLLDKMAEGSFITFKAAADIDVYIMEHRDSNADLSTWNLVEENFPVEPHLFFKGGADIYTRYYRKGETVSIPGTDTRRGWANLVFIRYARSNYVKIISPQPGSELKPFQTIRYAGLTLGGLAYTHPRWAFSFDGIRWYDVESAASGRMEIPYVDLTTEFLLRVTLVDDYGQKICDQIAKYLVRNDSGITLYNPAEGTRLLTGETVQLEYLARDLDGHPLTGELVSWEQSFNYGSWQPVIAGTVTAPAAEGILRLKARFPVSLNRSKERIISFTVAEHYETVTINFGQAAGGEYTLGEETTRQLSGKIYGFTEDHTGRINFFYSEKGRNKWVKDTSISLKEQAAFEYVCGRGYFAVTVAVKPEEYRGEYLVMVEGSGKSLTAERWNAEQEVRLTVEVLDNILTVGGSKDLPVVELRVRELTEEEYAAGLKEDKPPGRNEHGDGDKDDRDGDKDNRDGDKDRGEQGKKGGRR